MKPILVLYATREGHTRQIAERIAARLRSQRVAERTVDAREGAEAIDLAAFHGVILAASVHTGHHEPELVRFVKRHASELDRMPTALVSVSLSQAGVEDPARTKQTHAQAEKAVQGMLEDFFKQTTFRPKRVQPVAGALLYTQYNWFIRFIMKRIAKAEGGSTDTSRDHDYTDWAGVDRFVDDLLASDFRGPPEASEAAGRASPAS